MEIIKKMVIGLAFMLILSLLVRYGSNENNIILKIFVITSFALFIFNLVVRRTVWFQPYFTSKFNILTSKFKVKKEYNFSKNILFHKIIEVIKSSGFRVLKIDEDRCIILAATNISWISWGENIYIRLEESGDKTIMNFCSATYFGVYSWNKNEQNYNKLIATFEDSLTI